ncbi:MAG: polyamine aminopropyltransferase [Clostridiaceae bacterium]|nr:polyamine aminopropyltransferase [Clostridiaceae bacterium]
MDLWLTEFSSPDAKFSIRVEKQLYSHTSDFQQIDIFQTPEFGRVLVLDGIVMLTEKDEFIYHEMMVHVPMAVHPNVRTVLLIGAGDGGSLRELCRYPDIECIDMVEIDREVVNACRRFLPEVAASFNDPRLNLVIGDGISFVRTKQDEYDLIIVDSTDPFGPGEDLFTREFYANCYNALHSDGIMTNQHESPYYDSDAQIVRHIHARTTLYFPITKVYQAHIPTYPSGHWLFGFSSRKYDPVADLRAEEWLARGIETDYYNIDLHRGCFALPTYVQQLLSGGDV